MIIFLLFSTISLLFSFCHLFSSFFPHFYPACSSFDDSAFYYDIHYYHDKRHHKFTYLQEISTQIPGHTAEILHRHPVIISKYHACRDHTSDSADSSGQWNQETQYNQINAQYHSCNSGRCTFRKICHHTFLPCLWKCNYRQSTQCSR